MRPHRRGQVQQDAGRWRTAGREAVVVGTGLLVYQASRLLGGHDVAAAHLNSGRLLEAQQALMIPSETSLQGLLLKFEELVVAANAYYAAAHLPVTGLALLWLLLGRAVQYRRARRALLLSTGAALVLYLLVPVAPPRMLPGFVDTAALHGPSVYGDAGASVWANQYAAFPSLHVGWALLVAIACTSASATRWRWLWWLHPTVTVLVVVGTANHYWLDAAAAAVLVLSAWAIGGPRGRAVRAIRAVPGSLRNG